MLNYEFPPIGGGTGIACRELLRALGPTGAVDVDLVTAGVGHTMESESLVPNVTVHRIPVGKGDLHFWRPAELLRWTRRARRLALSLTSEGDYDLCHCWAGWPPGLLGYGLRRRLPYLVALRGSDVPGYSPRLRLLDPLVFRHLSRLVWGRASAVVAVSDELCDLALRTVPELEAEVIPNAVDVGRFGPGPRPERFTVLFVGRLIPRKGAADLVDAFATVVDRVPDARLVVVGGGPEEPALRARAEGAGIGAAVSFLGQVPDDELPSIYRDASVFVLPSRREGMPNVLLEAMASSLPVVTTAPAGGLVDGNGVLVDVADPDGIAAALLDYAADENLRCAHGRRSREIAESSGWTEVARWYIRIYRRMVEGGRPAMGAQA
jgi:glycosyltransferase involved in cell wall biosynthesis